MEPTGIFRRIDDLGRIVIPVEIRKVLGIETRDSLEIFIDEGSIILRKYNSRCVFCGRGDNIKSFHEKNVCLSCIRELSKS